MNVKLAQSGNILWKAISFPGFRFLTKLEVIKNSNNPQSMGNVKFHAMGIFWGKLIYSHTIGFE